MFNRKISVANLPSLLNLAFLQRPTAPGRASLQTGPRPLAQPTPPMVTNNKETFKVAGAAPARTARPAAHKYRHSQRALPRRSVPPPWPGGAGREYRGWEGRVLRKDPQLPRPGPAPPFPARGPAPLRHPRARSPAALRHPRPGAQSGPAAIARSAPATPPARRPPAIGHRRQLPRSLLVRRRMVGGASPPGVPLPFPWRQERRRSRGPGKPVTPGTGAAA